MTFSTKNGKTEYIYIKGKKGKVNPKTISNKVKTGHIQRVQEHKALGTWFKEDGLLNAEIENKKAKLPLMISTTKKQASPSNLGILAVEGRLKLIETVVIPSILHNLEAQQSISQKHLDELERIQLNLLTEILEIPRTTPYLPLLIETGFLKMEARLAYNRLMLYHNLLKSDDKRVAKLIMEEQEKLRRDSTWKTTIDRELSKYNIDLDPKETSKSVWKKHIKDKIKNQNAKEVTENCKEKTKTRFVKNDQYKLKSYLSEIPLNEAKQILKVRLNMIKIPSNYKNSGKSVICPLCAENEGTAEHYFRCAKVDQLKRFCEVQLDDMVKQDVRTLRNLATFFEGVETMMGPLFKPFN